MINQSDQDVLAKLKARLVEKSLARKSPEELAAIAVAGLSLGGLARVGSVTLQAAIATAESVGEAEKYAENILAKTTTGNEESKWVNAKWRVG